MCRIAVGVLLVGFSVTACGEEPSFSPTPPSRYAEPMGGFARLVNDTTDRIIGTADVSSQFSKVDSSAVWAATLIDARIGTGRPRGDFDHRPVLVGYKTTRGAREAVADLSSERYAIHGRNVIYFPPRFPREAATDYRHALTIGAQ